MFHVLFFAALLNVLLWSPLGLLLSLHRTTKPFCVKLSNKLFSVVDAMDAEIAQLKLPPSYPEPFDPPMPDRLDNLRAGRVFDLAAERQAQAAQARANMQVQARNLLQAAGPQQQNMQAARAMALNDQYFDYDQWAAAEGIFRADYPVAPIISYDIDWDAIHSHQDLIALLKVAFDSTRIALREQEGNQAERLDPIRHLLIRK